MKGVILFFSLTFSSVITARTYYVQDPANNINAHNSNDGINIKYPWATLLYSIGKLHPGDTLFVRGGVYYLTSTLRLDAVRDGTRSNPIVMINYPNEKPIIDCSRINAGSGIVINRISYWVIQGLEQRNAFQDGTTNTLHGVAINYCNNIHLNYLNIHHNGGCGLDIRMSNEIYIRGLDTYNNCDSLNSNPAYNGGKGDGNGCMNYTLGSDTTSWGKIYFDKCRSWNNSDDGFGIGYQCYVYVDSCWSWNNGSPLYAQGAGRGFSTGHAFYPQTVLPQIILTNCIAVYNKGTGFYHNCNSENYPTTQAWYNCLSAFNKGWGFYGLHPNGHPPSENIYWKNNIAYKNNRGTFSHEGLNTAPSYIRHDHNSWNLRLAVSDADFISLDTTGISEPRKADGSFPDNHCYDYFMRLTSKSKFVNAGVNVGLPYVDIAPDLGPFEYQGPTSGFTAILNISVKGLGGSNTISSDKGTLQLLATIVPENATYKSISWSIENNSGQATINLKGLVTAKANGTVTAIASANDGSGVYGTFTITISNQTGEKNQSVITVVNYNSISYSGFVNEIDASGTYDLDNDRLTFSWIVPDKIQVSSTSGSITKYLSPITDSPRMFEFILIISDSKDTFYKRIPLTVLPYKPELEEAEVINIEASSYISPFYPFNAVDGISESMWSSIGDNEWLILELKNSFVVDYIILAFHPEQTKESFFDIFGSDDKIFWKPVLIKSNSCAFASDLQTFDFPATKADKEFRYIKIVERGNSVDEWNYIAEIKLFGFRITNYQEYENLPVKIYPNPAKLYFTVHIDRSEIKPDLIQVIHPSGIVLITSEVDPNIRELKIPINLPNGIYIVSLYSGGLTRFTQKLIVGR
jgi:hypothetical protein